MILIWNSLRMDGNMTYGTLTLAKQYNDAGKIKEWLQLFLRNDGKNIALADGLLLEEREYLGLMKLRLSLFNDIKHGTPEYLTDQNSIDYFWYIVQTMHNNRFDWDMPPLIVQFANNTFYINDGRHRLEMLRQTNATDIDVVVWTTGNRDKQNFYSMINEGE